MTGRPKKPYVFVTCHRCNRRWPCTATTEKVTCPGCGYKTLRIKPKEKKGNDPEPGLTTLRANPDDVTP